MSSGESPQVPETDLSSEKKFSGENEIDYEAMSSDEPSEEERRLDSLLDIVLDELNDNLDLACNEAACSCIII